MSFAIVGIGCQFPGAPSRRAFWANVRDGADAIGEIPATHFAIDDYYDPDPRAKDRIYARRGGFLQPVDFDPLRWGIAPRDLEATDTTQLLGLMVAQAALDDAGYGPSLRPLPRERTSVILGVTGALELVIPLGARLGQPQWRRALHEAGVDPETAERVIDRMAAGYVPWQENSFPGLLGNVAAGRIANRLDLHGTNCVVDAACASSLSAVHLGLLELQSGRADLVLAGGLDTFNDIFMYMCFSKTPALSRSGDARPFDADGDGTILGEGLGIVVLKRLADAERDGDRIYAVVRGLGSSSDGKGEAVYAPVPSGQARALRRAYDEAGIPCDSVGLVEAHGTGTKVGDAVELEALREVFGASGGAPWCAIGSVKSMIGHTKAAAGAAGLIKAALAIYHRTLPPTLKVRRPASAIAADDSPFYLNVRSRPWWNAGLPRRAGVSAFGFGGSNFHCVIEQHGQGARDPDWDGRVQILAWSADSPAAIRAAIQASASACREATWGAVERIAAQTRASFEPTAAHRCTLVLERADDRKAKFAEALAAAETAAPLPSGRGDASYGHGPAARVAVLFPGQGAQTVGMLVDLACRFPRFGAALEAVGPEIARKIYPQARFERAVSEADEDALRATEVAQPALAAVEWGAFTVLEAFGLQPDAAAGHSFGELVALAAAGRLDPAELVRLAHARGQRMQAAAQGSQGSMLAVVMPLPELDAWVSEHAPELCVANRNAPTQGVLSGPVGAIDRAQADLGAAGVRCVRLSVAAAFHSPQVAAAAEAFAADVSTTSLQGGRFPVLANATAMAYPSDASQARAQLAAQLATPVDFVGTLERLAADGIRAFVELGPGRRLTGLVRDTLGAGVTALALDDGAASGGLRGLARLLAGLAALGHPVRLSAWETYEETRDAVLPSPPPKLAISVCGAHPKPSAPPPGRTAPARAAVPAARPPVTAARPPVPPSPALERSMPPADDLPTPQRAPAVAPITAAPPPAVASLAVDRHLGALLQLAQQTAALHQQFLEHQAEATRLFERLMFGSPDPHGVPPKANGASAQGHAQGHAPAHALPSFAALATPTNGAGSHGGRPPLTGFQAHGTNGTHGSSTSLGPSASPGPNGTHGSSGSLGPSASLGANGTHGTSATHGQSAAYGESATYGTSAMHGQRATHGSNGTHAAASAWPHVGVPGARPSGDAPPKRQAGPEPHQDGAATAATLLAIVAEKTGYPESMLNLDMGLDADLGIDSIKRVEILSAMQEALPHTSPIGADRLAELHTLRDIAQALGGPAASSKGASKTPQDATSSATPAADTEAPGGRERAGEAEIAAALLGIVAEKTGYPASMLGLDMGLDADLGIDSIKRVEIFAALQEAMPNAPVLSADAIAELRTLREIVAALAPSLAPSAPASLAVVEEDTVRASVPARGETRRPQAEDADVEFPTLVPWTPTGQRRPSEGTVWIVGTPDTPRRDELRDALTQWGFEVVLEAPGPATKLGGIVFLQGGPQALVALAQHLPRLVDGAWVASLCAFDGGFGFRDGVPRGAEVQGAGLAGLVKTLARERPDLHCRALDVAPSVALADDRCADALLCAGPVEIGVGPEGSATVSLTRTTQATAGAAWKPGPTDVVLLSGGARGVTAAIARDLAGAGVRTVVLLGRTPLPGDEPAWLRDLSTEAQIKQGLLLHGNLEAKPAAIGSACAAVLAAREVQDTLRSLAASGTEVVYRSVDVTDQAAVLAVLSEVRRDHGPVTMLVHGAGVLADRRIEDKVAAEVERVYATKVAGLEHLLAGLDLARVRAIALFSSSTARFGRRGQADYAMANEVLNKRAHQLAATLPAARVLSVNWGPFEGGMVTPSLQALFAREGVGVIDPDQGAVTLRALLATPGPTEAVVIAPAPSAATPLPTILHRTLRLTEHTVLEDHVLDGRAVLPIALSVEWLAHAALHDNPGLGLHGIDDLQVLRGVRCSPADAVPLELAAGPARAGAGETDGLVFAVPTELRPTGSKTASHAARILLGPRAQPEGAHVVPPAPEAEAGSPYDHGVLFHGPRWHALAWVGPLDAHGGWAHCQPAPRPEAWMGEPLRRRWIADPWVLDAGFQLAILWSQRHLGAPCLPSGWSRYRQYCASFEPVARPGNRVMLRLRVTEHGPGRLVCDLDWFDAAGRPLARLEGLRSTVDPGLRAAFARSRITAEPQPLRGPSP